MDLFVCLHKDDRTDNSRIVEIYVTHITFDQIQDVRTVAACTSLVSTQEEAASRVQLGEGIEPGCSSWGEFGTVRMSSVRTPRLF